MKILYDPEKDVLSIVLKNDDEGFATQYVDENVGLTVNEEKEVVAVDILSASAYVDLSTFAIDLKHDLGTEE